MTGHATVGGWTMVRARPGSLRRGSKLLSDTRIGAFPGTHGEHWNIRGFYEFTLPVGKSQRRGTMNNIIYIVGLVVVVLAVLSFFGLRR